MMVVLCMLWVANMALACSKTNEFWWGNMMSAFIITACVADLVSK